MIEETAAIEAALETEQSMMARQRLFKRRWKLEQAAAHVEKESHCQPQDKDRSNQNECNVV